MQYLMWSRPALSAVQKIHGELRESNPTAAQRAVQAIRRCVEGLRRNPEAGHPWPDMDPEFRELLTGSHGAHNCAVTYRYDGEIVVILAVHKTAAATAAAGMQGRPGR